jgi:alpha-tubulin suppressor-like RCC1 family protein
MCEACAELGFCGNQTHGSSNGSKSPGHALWCWGYNEHGQVGDGTRADQHSPVLVGSGSDWVQVRLGMGHSCGVRNDGSAWWGANSHGQLGDGDGFRETPTVVTR